MKLRKSDKFTEKDQSTVYSTEPQSGEGSPLDYTDFTEEDSTPRRKAAKKHGESPLETSL